MHSVQESCIQGLVGKPEGERPLGRPTHRREDIIRKDQQVRSSGMDWSDLPRVAGSCECGKEPSSFIKYGIVDQLRRLVSFQEGLFFI